MAEAFPGLHRISNKALVGFRQNLEKSFSQRESVRGKENKEINRKTAVAFRVALSMYERRAGHYYSDTSFLRLNKTSEKTNHYKLQ